MNLGLDIGNSRIKAVVINDKDLLFSKAVYHKGKISNCLKSIIDNIYLLFGEKITNVGITGLSHKNETESIIEGLNFMKGDFSSLLEVGARKSLFINNINNSENLEIFSNSGCSAGTGSFFEEQATRLNIKIEELSNGIISDNMPKIAGRCSVFARTDIIHHQQEGRDINHILGGLSMAVAKSLKAHLIKNRKPALPLLITGGLALNKCFVQCLHIILDIPDESIIVTEESQYPGAIGAAKTAQDKFNKKTVLELITDNNIEKKVSGLYPPLHLFGNNDYKDKHILHRYNGGELYMGVDIGSTSINLVLLDKNQNVIKLLYLRNHGKPEENVLKGIKTMEDELGFALTDIPCCVTGSGRKYIAGKLGTELTRDEITTQARGCLYSVKNVDTILEIGGQDSKFISIKDNSVNKFKMNKVCAAGTGAFLEEQASAFGISLEDFVQNALKSENPALMNERCTVFIEGVRSRLMAEGRSVEDISAGLCYAVVQNYLQRVAENRDLGNRIVLQGGIAYNQGVTNGFRSITGKEIIIPDYFSVTGALGSALIAMESSFASKKKPIIKNDTYYETQYMKGYTGHIDPNKKTVGIPRILFIHKLFPLFNQFFKSLNLNVILSDMNDPEIISLSQENSFVETCYPIKLAYGHVASLIKQKPDFIFIPSLLTMKHEGSKARKDSACVFMQTLGSIMDGVFDFKVEGIELINPGLNMEEGPKAILKSLQYSGKQLGIPKLFIIKAIFSGFKRFKTFKNDLIKKGKSTVKILENSNDPVFVIVTRSYGIKDPVLNKGIMKEVRSQGYRVLTLDSLPVEDYGLKDYPHLSWPFGQHILNGVEIVRKSDNMQLIYLTNHGCGPDSILSHYVDNVMLGKPYLAIEIDEHSSATGIKTRIEAFINSLKNRTDKIEEIIVPDIYPLNRILDSVYKDIKLITPPVESFNSEMEKGKEYATLSALYSGISDIINPNSTIFIPRNEGAEVDGQYASFIIENLRKQGYKDVKLQAPYLEDIPGLNSEKFKKIWDSILLHDIMNIHFDEKIMDNLTPDFFIGNTINDTAYKVLKKTETDQNKILLIGDPFILYHKNWLENEIISPLKSSGFTLQKAPLTEMLYLLWQRKNNNSPMHKANLLYAQEKLVEVAQILGKKGSFTLDLNNLLTCADSEIGMAQGGFMEYIIAKMKVEEKNFCAMVRVSSMYDNSAMVASLKEYKLNIPRVHIQYHSLKNAANITDIDNMICLINNRKKQPVI